MKRIVMGLSSLALVFATAACSGNDAEPQPEQVTVTAEPTPTPTPEPTPVEPTPVEPEQDIDALFVDVIKDNTNAFDSSPDQDIVALAQSMCDQWDNGVSLKSIVKVFTNNGIPVGEAGFFIGAGTEAYCPEYSDSLTGGTGT